MKPPVAAILRRLILVPCLFVALTAQADLPVDFHTAIPAGFTSPTGSAPDFERLRGHPAVVNFWATWCPPCREELPILAKAHKRLGKKAAFLGIAVENNAEFAGEYARVQGIHYPVAVGREPAIALMQALGNKHAGMPYTVVLDAAGKVVFSKIGVVTEKDLAQALQPRRP